MTLGGKKFDGDKPRMELLPLDVLEQVAQVLAYGAKKYGENNFREGFKYSRLLGATLRHLSKWQNGENLDQESGLSHLSHAIASLMFLVSHDLHREGTDDRYIKSSKDAS